MKKFFNKIIAVALALTLIMSAVPFSTLSNIELPKGDDKSISSSIKNAANTVSEFVKGLFVKADAAETSGKCGDNLTWAFDTSTGALTITGSGDMKNYTGIFSVPWYSYREQIKSISLPNGLTSIGKNAFRYCTSLSSIEIPDSVTSIGNDAFNDCRSLSSIEIPDSVTSIGDFAFCYCTSLTSIEIPDSVTSIGENAFYYCTSLSSIEIPDSVTSIGNDAFCYCTSLTNIDVDSSNPAYSSQAGVLFNKDKTELIQYPIGNSRTNYAIPDSVTSIGENAFYYCTSLSSIEIPDSVTSIGDFAFYYCTSLTSITIPDSVSSIGESAFESCTSLTNITIPDSVTSIGWLAFHFCTSLTSVTIYNSTATIDYAFSGCSSDLIIYGYIGSTAQEYAEENNIVFLPIESAFIKINGNDETVITNNFRVYGFANPEIEVSIFCDGVVIGKTTSAKNGRWSFEGKLPNVQNDKEYTIVAQITFNSNDCTSNEHKITYNEHAVLLDSLETIHSSYRYLITRETKGNASGYISIAPSFPVTFITKLLNNDKVKTVKIVAVDGNETKEYPAKYDKAQGAWISTAYFSGSFCPDKIYIVVNENQIIDPDYKCRFVIDPSGFAYEAVKSNVLEDVTSSIYYLDENNNEALWDADYYDQINPQTTPSDGSFAWDVPKGKWQVRLEKDGYTSASSEWLDVPPEQTNIYIPMVSTVSPEVEYINVYNNGAELRFSQYMDIASINAANINIGNVSGTWTAVDSEESGTNSSISYARTFKFTANETISGTVAVSISGCNNYAGKAMQSYSANVTVKTELTAINAPEIIDIKPGESKSVTIAVLPANTASGSIKIENMCNRIATAPGNVSLNENGTASITVTGVIPGMTELTVTYPGTSLKAKIKVNVDFENMPDDTPTLMVAIRNNPNVATIDYGDGIKLTADVFNMPEGAKIVWYVDGEKAGEGENFTLSKPKNSVTVTVKIVDKNGNVIVINGNEVSDTETVKVNNGFFKKLIAFFKNIFGMLKVHTQRIKYN